MYLLHDTGIINLCNYMIRACRVALWLGGVAPVNERIQGVLPGETVVCGIEGGVGYFCGRPL